MADTVITAPAGAPATMAEELTALFGKDEKPTVPAPEPAPGEPSSPPPDSPPKEGEAVKEPTLEEQVEAIVKEAPVEEAKPALSPEQSTILETVGSVETLQALQGMALGFKQLSDAYGGGDFAGFETILKQGNPSAYEAFIEHIYQEQIGKPGEKSAWLTRWVEEQTNGKTTSAATRALEQRVSALQAKLDRDEAEKQSQTAGQTRAKNIAAFNSHLDSLWDRVKFSPKDRDWLRPAIVEKANNDPSVRAAIKAGNLSAINKIWAEVTTAYSKKDKEASETVGAKLKLQETHKLPVGGSSTETTAPTDMASAKTPEERGAVMRNQLTDLFKRAK